MRWLYFRLGLISAAFAFCAALIATIIAPMDTSVAQYTGIIVSYGFSISSMLMQFVITLVNMEGEMASVERLIEYQHLPTEESAGEAPEPGQGWPADDAEIRVEHLNFRYRPELELTLRDVSFTLRPREHVGIVGRTGAGKSSITVAMFRLAKPERGSEIVVDGVNVLSLELHRARGTFAIIPQEPFLFSGTLRQNLDPYAQAEAEGVSTAGLSRIPDREIWRALERVQMKEFVEKQPGQLDCRITANGDNLSAGQRQLVCVARAVLRRACCVILDEATAQVDRENDRLIQETIRTAFADVTVLSIAHRLDTIIDFDRILVMDRGRAAEFDTPANLLRRQDGIFADLVAQTGEENAARLRAAAFAAENAKRAKFAKPAKPATPANE